MHLSLTSTLTQRCDISTGQERRDLRGDLRWTKDNALGADESGDGIDEHVERRPPHVEREQYLGRDKTLEVSPRFCRTFPAEWKPGYKEYVAKNAAALEALGYAPGDAPPIPDYSMKRDELQVSSHWQDFIDCVRSRAMPRCGVDRAFEEAATIFLSVEAYKRNAKVRWDAASETIVNV